MMGEGGGNDDCTGSCSTAAMPHLTSAAHVPCAERAVRGRCRTVRSAGTSPSP